MLDRLPTELVAHILSFVDPPSPFHLTKPSSLHACCLVSKRIKVLAQPLLWRVLVLKEKADFEAVKREAGASGLGKQARVLEVKGSACQAVRVAEVLILVPKLVELRLESFVCDIDAPNEVDELLPHLAHLNRLAFELTDFPSALTAPVFPHLVSLALRDVFVQQELILDLLQPFHVPALRTLQLANLYDPGPPDHFLPVLPRELLDQVSVLHLDISELWYADSAVFEHAHILLATSFVSKLDEIEPSAFPFNKIRHLQIMPSSFDPSESSDAASFDTLLTRFAQNLPSLELHTLLLPPHLHQPSLDLIRRNILDICRTKDIDVLWEGDVNEWRDTVWVSEQFCQLMEERKKSAATGSAG
ncbi:hypothetical protein JCM6882_004430 [Rhodosporidiobolus microsporus]